MITYLLTHWRGQQSLARTFWVNLVGLRFLIFLSQSRIVENVEASTTSLTTFVYVLVLLLHGVLLVWQIVGVIRACDQHYAEHSSMATLWGAQLGAVLLGLMSALYALEAVQLTMKPAETENVFALIDSEHAAQYELSFSENNCQMRIDGLLALGITKAVRKSLSSNHKVRTIVLNSEGGNIYEGRGLANLITKNGLHTHVNQQCASACTLAYIGGLKRTAGQSAKFGFHQYRIEANYDIIATDVVKEQNRDISLFLRSGVADSFTQRMFSRVSSGMWWPDLQMLENVGVLEVAKDECYLQAF